jgi:hypothetical protein
MSYSNAKRRRIKPFARPTSFDINVAYDIRHYQRIKYGNVIDPYFPAVGTDEAFKVLEGEVLMQTNNPDVRRYGDHQMHVFSFANGLKANGATLNASYGEDVESPAKAAVLENLKYAGVAVTEFTPERDVFEQGFVMTMGGLNTLFNNGSSIIYPGDILCADIPSAAAKGSRKNRALQTGVPHDKLQFIVTPYEGRRGLKTQVGESLASRFIMGTALSYSRPGAPVDIVLHKCNVCVSGGASAGRRTSRGERGAGLSGSKGMSLAASESKKPKVKATKKKSSN